MKLVEVIILAGTHCISPLQHADGLTDASKVSCAVIIEKDTVANTVAVMPPWQVNAPEVRLALTSRGNALPAAAQAQKPALHIEPAAARPEPIAAPPPVPPADVPDPVPDAEADSANQPLADVPEKNQEQPEAADASSAEISPEAEPPQPPTKLSDATPPNPAPAVRAARPSRAPSGQCLGEAKPAWYTNKDGRRKFRCVVPGKTKLY